MQNKDKQRNSACQKLQNNKKVHLNFRATTNDNKNNNKRQEMILSKQKANLR